MNHPGQQFINRLNQIYPEIIEIRRQFHKYPELSFQEHKTSQFICEKLNEYNIPYDDGIAGTGIVAQIKGKNPSHKIIALRADMDALPVNESNELEYKSERQGIMHACGHDVHLAVLLGTARILNELKHDLEGSIILIFQPGEEKIPGGAKQMIEEGVLENPKPDIILGLHVMPGLETGKVAFAPGKIMASADEIYIKVKGKGGHAALPDELIDPILIASYLITSLQQVVSRNANPATPCVLSFGKIEGCGAANIIPGEVNLSGTLRTMNEEWREKAHRIIVNLCQSITSGMGGSCDVEIRKGYPFLENNEYITSKARAYAENLLGKENVTDLKMEMTAEDFAYYAQIIPATFYLLGITNKEEGNNMPLHSPDFMVDEKALITGISTMTWITLEFLKD